MIPSLWEEPGLTYVLLEWLATGRPVLSTRRGGLAEAAALGGVSAFDPTAAGLLSAAITLREPRIWATVLDRVPTVTDRRDLDRWAEAHLAAYEAAMSRSAASR